MTRQGKAALFSLIGRVLADETELQGSLVTETLTRNFNLLRQLDEIIDVHDRQLREQAQHDVNIKRLQQIPGIGPVTASALVAAVGNGAQFQCGRAMSSWLGLVPRQHSTGGRARLGRISKQGNRHLRTLLIHGPV